MDIKIKEEPAEIYESNEYNMNVNIKMESELIIENDTQWLPTKLEDEQNEYYQELEEDCGQQLVYPEKLCKNEAYENDFTYEQQHYTVEYINEIEDYDDDDEYDNSYYGESEEGEKNETDEECILDSEYNLDVKQNLIEDYEKQEEEEANENVLELDSKTVCKFSLNKWLANNYVNRECPACKGQFGHYYEWRKHIELFHQDCIKDSECNYNLTDKGGVCKKCNREFSSDFARYIHSIRHTEDGEKLDINICKICNYISPRNVYIQKHIVEEHPETIEKFKQIFNNVKQFKCPICHCIYNKYSKLLYHFMDKHPQEYKEKFLFNCYLCLHQPFSEEELYLQHLMENHELNSWELLNYRKLFEDKEYFACKKCFRVFIKNDERKLLKHFLEHESSCNWTCKFCTKKIAMKDSNYSHMCIKMFRCYEKRNKNVQVLKTPKTEVIEKEKISLKEFEEYIGHVCPFCRAEFNKMIKWQLHLRKVHEIDTLKGLGMKVIPADSNKLCCVLCYTVVQNSPIQLHNHRFQHLPYKPYKCLNCTQSLSTFKMAANHVLKRCKDEEDRDYIKNVLVPQIVEPINYIRKRIRIQCSFCNYKEFPNAKAILEHYQHEHNNFEEFYTKQGEDDTMTCKICNKQYVQYDHVHNHFDEKTFKCPLCLYSYVRFKSCYRHLLEKHYAKPIDEQELEKGKANIPEKVSFLNKKDNYSKVPQLAKPSIKTYVLNEFAEFITFACPECNEGISKQENWHHHITTQHNFFDESNLYVKDANGSLKCQTCNLILTTRVTQLQKHKLTHMPYRSFICKLCYARCNSLGVLYGHFRRKHFAQGTFKCPLCPEVLQTEHQKAEHLKKIHPRNEWPTSTCLICYKILSSKSALNNHMATHDRERFKYTCEVCQTKIIGFKDFQLHTARHAERGEVAKVEKTEDNDNSSQNRSKSNQTNHTDDDEQDMDVDNDDKVIEYKRENVKRNSLTKSSAAKKKKN